MSDQAKCPHCGAENMGGNMFDCLTIMEGEKVHRSTNCCEAEIATLRQQLADEKAKRVPADNEILRLTGLLRVANTECNDSNKIAAALRARLEAAEAKLEESNDQWNKHSLEWEQRASTLTSLLRRANEFVNPNGIGHHFTCLCPRCFAIPQLQNEIAAALEGKPTRDAEALLKEAEGVLEPLAIESGHYWDYQPEHLIQVPLNHCRAAAALLAKIRSVLQDGKSDTPRQPIEKVKGEG